MSRNGKSDYKGEKPPIVALAMIKEIEASKKSHHYQWWRRDKLLKPMSRQINAGAGNLLQEQKNFPKKGKPLPLHPEQCVRDAKSAATARNQEEPAMKRKNRF